MRCCGNCFWCFTQDDEENLEGYNEYETNKPQAGDCCIGQEHDENYCCSKHEYIDGMEEYVHIVLYDDSYFGKGYLIITKLDNKIVNFMKICKFGEGGFPQFYIRAFEKNKCDNPEDIFKEINITANNDDQLYSIIRNYAINTNQEILETIDLDNHGKNNIKAKYNLFNASLIISKDIYGVKYPTNYTDVYLGDNETCKYYKEISKFYNELAEISKGKIKEGDIKKLLLLK